MGDIALAGADGSERSLPRRLTSFIGREPELDQVCGLLGSYRLVTLVGAGGCGKTRLALETAERSLPELRDGAFFVDLSAVMDPERVPGAVAAALSIDEQPGRTVLDAITSTFGDKQALVILDNCEQVAPACAELTDDLLARCRDLRILATSRASLHAAAETAFGVPSMSLAASDASFDDIVACDAVRLFVERAHAGDASFVLSEATASIAADICRNLDGMPLAVELAAARARVLGLQDLNQRLSDRFALLKDSTATLPRHQTLHTAIDWSHDLLTDPQRTIFRRLSVFCGSFDLSSAEAVCTTNGLQGDSVLDLMSELVDCSLVVSDPQPDGTIRLRLLETLRAYASEQLDDAAEQEAVADAHLRVYSALAEEAYQGRIDESGRWLQRLEAEHDNLRGALAWASSTDGKLLELAGALAWYWHLHSHFAEGREHLERALERRHERNATAARALIGLAFLECWQGDIPEARAHARSGMEIAIHIDEPLLEALGLELLGWSHFFEGTNAEGLVVFERAAEIFDRLGNPRLANRGRLNVGQILVAMEQLERAEAVATQLLDEGTRLNEARDIHLGHHYLADVALLRDDPIGALPRYRDALRWALVLGDRSEIAIEVQGVAMALAGIGRDAESVTLDAGAKQALERFGVDISGIHFWNELLDRYTNAACTRLSAESAKVSMTEGAGLGFEQVVAHALDDGGQALPVGSSDSSFILEGEYWSISFDGSTFRLRDTKGMRYLAQLFAVPGREVHALDLGGAATTGGMGETLDAKARRSYRDRIIDLQQDVEEARSAGDIERAARSQEELEQIAHALTAGQGLGGRTRPTGSAAERARVSVTRALRDAITKLETQNPGLGRHLDVSIRTGTFCSYSPDPHAKAEWRLN